MLTANWFNEARFGMFIHWGAYAVAARGEWVMNRERIAPAEYAQRHIAHFKAERYDPREWARLATRAGMKYMVLTTRHHDGFCLWDSRTSRLTATRLGPKRDLLRPFVEAVRAAGLKLGFYFSVADWSHPDYPGAHHRDWPTRWPKQAARKRFVAYYRAQLEELLTRYGPVDLLWYDGCIPQPTDGAEVNAFVKSLQPGILINDRNGAPCDFYCSEQKIKAAAAGQLWEACMTLNNHWGYHAGDHDWKSARQVIRLLTDTAAGGGNLLLNVGPRADGTIPEESVRILTEVGDWLQRNGEFLPGSCRSPFPWNNWGKLTTRGNIVYAHLFHIATPELCIADIKNAVTRVRRCDTGQPVAFQRRGERLFVRGLPVLGPGALPVTLAIEVKGQPQPVSPQETFWIPG
jgi:alpha-L-fucosidase